LVAPVPAAASINGISCILLIEVIPRLVRLKLETTKTLADLERQVAAKWELGKLEVEFVIGNKNDEDRRVIPKSTAVEGLPVQGSPEVVGVREASELGVDAASAGQSVELFDRLKTQVGAPANEHEHEPEQRQDAGAQVGTPYRFSIGSREEQRIYYRVSGNLVSI
jgi:hypothetical protein